MHEPPLILLLDDRQEHRAELCALLERSGLRPAPALPSKDLQRSVLELRPDLVLLSCDAPVPQGVELLRALKSASPEVFVPVVMLSSRADRETRLGMLRLGADDFIPRPGDDEELVVRLQALLRIKAQQDRAAARNTELERLSVTDELTGLHNRRYFRERLREEFRRAQRYGEQLSLIIIDLDHFKAINDRRGHLAGDEALKQASRLLPGCVRETDVVSRFGGEEFTILLPQTHLSGSLTVAERVWRALRSHHFAINGADERLTASLGVSSYPNKEIATPEDLLRTADDALYRAKRTGRDKICLHQAAGYFLANEDEAGLLPARRSPPG